MRISKRDRNLLILLGIVALLAAYYFILMVPTETKIDNLETELLAKESDKQLLEMKMASEKNLDSNLETIENELAAQTDAFYEQISQEEMLAVVESFAEGMPINFTDIAITSNMSQNPNAEKYVATVGYQGDYETLLSYIRNVRNHSKKIRISDLSISNDFDAGIKGKMALEFNAIPVAAQYSAPSEKLVKAEFNTRDILMSPFTPYENFEVVSTEPEMTEPEVIFPEYEFDEEDPIDYENYRPKTQLYGFEEGNFFFVANNEDISGFLTRSKTKVAGGYSAEISVDFKTGRDYSEANLVFETVPVMISKQADYLGLWVYAYEASNHNIGAVIIDAKGKEYKVELTNGVDWTQWQEVEVEMPVEITYPCMVQRIYVEGIGYDQKLTGKYLFDQLQVSYPVQ